MVSWSETVEAQSCPQTCLGVEPAENVAEEAKKKGIKTLVKFFGKDTAKDISINQSNILIMGLTFKENCPDIRNTLIAKLVEDFKESNCNVDVFDPWVDKEEAYKEYQINPINKPINGKYDAIVLAVAHNQFKLLTIEQLKGFCKESHVIYDLKYILPAEYSDGRL